MPELTTVTYQSQFEQFYAEGIRHFIIRGFIVYVHDDMKVELYDHSQARCYDNSQIILHVNSEASLWGNARCILYDYSFVHMCSNSNYAALFQHSRARMHHKSKAELFDNSEAYLYMESEAICHDSTKVEMYDSSKAKLYDFSIATIYNHTSTNIDKLSPLAQIININYPSDIKTWCLMKNIAINNNKIILFKAVNIDYTDFFTGKLKYEIGKEIVDPEWDPNYNQECGKGLHFSNSESWLRLYISKDHDNFKILKVEVDINDCKCIPGVIYFTNQIKARACKVIEEIC
jgi:hypothetical protein